MKMSAVKSALASIPTYRRVGTVDQVTPSHVRATGPKLPTGRICRIHRADTDIHSTVDGLAEVVASGPDGVVLYPFFSTSSVQIGDSVVEERRFHEAVVGETLSGRILDAFAEPLDGGHALDTSQTARLDARPPLPRERATVTPRLTTGVRTIDGLLTLSVGQRIGLFAAGGVGKTTLIRQIATHASCDRLILCLVGERGREVEGLSSDLAGPKTSCIAATSDQSAPVRARAVQQAVAAAEFWRARGEHVLLVIDSITRYAMALREMGLAAGEPPTVRAYTPNVFSALPKIVERCGATKNGGAITAVMAVLSETDDVDDPVVEVMKSLLDGHIILSRRIAERGIYPAIDIQKSVSRLADTVRTPAHSALARETLRTLSLYEESRLMIESGLYKAGSNPQTDQAISTRSAIDAFAHQPVDEHSLFETTLARLNALHQGKGETHV
ncbi:FliI/YscN family ATPase [Maricaulis sp. D1M11]|uniref:FliI/YscN family ATPase n=1 Tax=Maricaulis sp. D1M11 TaxID=3076117 RepID=UPI0039B3AE58